MRGNHKNLEENLQLRTNVTAVWLHFVDMQMETVLGTLQLKFMREASADSEATLSRKRSQTYL